MVNRTRKTLSIPDNDEQFLKWWDSQQSPSSSIRILVHQAIAYNDGEIMDVIASFSSLNREGTYVD